MQIFFRLNSFAEKIMKQMANKKLIILLINLLFIAKINAQEFSVSSNTLDLLNLGTINGEFGLSISPKWSLYIQAKINPFEYKSKNKQYENGFAKQFQNKQITFAAGARNWLWFVNSGWFIAYQVGYTKYNRGGIFKKDTYEGDAYGLTLSGGYSWILTKRINLEFGAGIMGGYTKFRKYECSKCGKILKNSKKFFIAPNNIIVQVAYLF